MIKDQYILGIETSCDETAASIVKNGHEIISNVVASQIESHKRFGGVVPEIASRHHVEQITIVIEEALNKANMTPKDLDAVAVTEGPGLVGALLIGINAAKAFAFANGLPLSRCTSYRRAYLCKCTSSTDGISSFSTSRFRWSYRTCIMKEDGQFELIGETRDDAAGEAYDKVARVLNLPYPGGPHIDRLANESDGAVPFPRAWLEEGSYDFSFSGLKSSVINYQHNAEQRGEEINPNHLAAGFQQSVVEVLTAKTLRAAREFKVKQVIAAGGVAANKGLRTSLVETFAKENIPFFVPPISLCTDNAAMIAAAGNSMFSVGKTGDLSMNGRPGLELNSWK